MYFTRLSFQKRLYISCFSLNLILLLVCCFAFYSHTTYSLKLTIQDTLTSNTSLLCEKLDNLLISADNSLKELQTDTSLLSIARKIPYSEKNYFSLHIPERTSFERAFRSVLLSHGLDGSLSFVSRYYDNVGVDSFSGAHEYLGIDTLSEYASLNRLLEEDFFVTYLPPHEEYWGSRKTVFTVVRSMRDTWQKYGIILLYLDISALSNLLTHFENPEDYSITILDENENFIYSTNPQLNQTAFMESFSNTADTQGRQQFSHDNVSISCYVKSKVTNWTFILTSSTENYLKSLKQALLISSLAFLALSIIMSTFLYFLTNALSRPLKQLCEQLKTLEPGKNINTKEIPNNDEIATLTNTVHGFLAEIYEQNNKLTKMRHQTLQAHYDAMEAQLNPHFLYNTLSVIGLTGMADGSNAVFNMCNNLSSLLRYSLSYTGQAVLLEQEITNTLNYLYLMKMRYEEDLIYQLELDEELNSIAVPKLILQPLVENCFQHGFQQTETEILPPWRIHISSFHDEDYWYISVSNNGAPFRQENLELLLLHLEHLKLSDYPNNEHENISKRQGYGLENTILRLHIYYHGKCYFRVASSDTDETTVTIGGPLKPQKTFSR